MAPTTSTKQVSKVPGIDEGFSRHVPKRPNALPSEDGVEVWNSQSNSSPLHAVPKTSLMPQSERVAADATKKENVSYGDHLSCGDFIRRPSSPTPSCASSSTFSAATTFATSMSSSSSSRASLSSCRSSFTNSSGSSSSHSRHHSHNSGAGRRGHRSWGGRSSSGRSSRPRSSLSSYSSFSSSSTRSGYSSSCQPLPCSGASGRGSGASGVDFFPKPVSSWSGAGGSVNRRHRESAGDEKRRRDSSSRDRFCSSSSSSSSRDRHFFPHPSRRSSGKDYASEASTVCSSGRKRNRSCSRERSPSFSRRRVGEGRPGGVKCERCLEWCRPSRGQRKPPITRTLQMDYYVRTPGCKAAKCKHIDFIDDVAYSREQFIEETVFTCPFTGVRRDTVLERNMFPYDVPTDVEHWTLWSREDLTQERLEAFVEKWAAENHPHAVEWECDNNEGERSIDWFHVHVFFRVACEDRTGVPRDPDSVYDGPYCRKEQVEMEDGEARVEEVDASSSSAAVAAAAASAASSDDRAESEGEEGAVSGSSCGQESSAVAVADDE